MFAHVCKKYVIKDTWTPKYFNNPQTPTSNPTLLSPPDNGLDFDPLWTPNLPNHATKMPQLSFAGVELLVDYFAHCRLKFRSSDSAPLHFIPPRVG